MENLIAASRELARVDAERGRATEEHPPRARDARTLAVLLKTADAMGENVCLLRIDPACTLDRRQLALLEGRIAEIRLQLDLMLAPMRGDLVDVPVGAWTEQAHFRAGRG